MKYSINIEKGIGEYAFEDYDMRTGRYKGMKVRPCTEYTTKEQGDLPLYRAMLMAAQEVWPYMKPAKAALVEADFTIAELCKVKEPPMLLDCMVLPEELLHFRFIVGANRYESSAFSLFNMLNGIRALARQGTKDKFHYERGKTATEYTEKTEGTEKPTFAELLRQVLLAA